MSNLNWWLMALAFLLGLLVTLAVMIRRVQREVPVYAAAKSGGLAANLKAPDVDLKKPKRPTSMWTSRRRPMSPTLM